MSWDEYFGIFVLGEVASAAVEKKENQLTLVNFTEQANNLNILTYKKGCEKGFWGKDIDTPTLGMKSSYLYLYDILVSLGIIEKKINGWSILTVASSHTITIYSEKLQADYLKSSIESSTSEDAVHIKNCYTVDYNKLSTFLIDYSKKDGKNGYNPADNFKRFLPSGGKKKRITKRRRMKSAKKP